MLLMLLLLVDEALDTEELKFVDAESLHRFFVSRTSDVTIGIEHLLHRAAVLHNDVHHLDEIIISATF